MSGIRNLSLKCSYAGKGEKILNDFLIPLLNEATGYDRITSFYTLDSLLAISQGVQSLFERGGHMRLIVGVHSIPSDLVEATLRRQYLQNQICQVRAEIQEGISNIGDSLAKRRLATLAWMIEDGLLEVKAASINGGTFHPKTLILRDSSGDTVAAIGSSNETGQGLGGNYEQIIALKSWQNPEDVRGQEDFFLSLWSGGDDDVTVSDIDEELASTILGALGDEYANPKHKASKISDVDGVIRIASQMPANFFVSGKVPALFQHQERAVTDALSRWPVRVLFADEVGLGKTFEAASTMAFLLHYCGVKKVVILTPKAVQQQWQDELYSHFGIEAWLFDSATRTYVSPTGAQKAMGSKNPVGAGSPEIALLSAQYARGSSGKKSIFERTGAVLPDLLVVDEAHAARVSKDISGKEKATRLYKMLETVTRQIPHVILATATPMQKEASEYHALLKLLGLPKRWQNKRFYKTSLDLISSDGIPDMNDANAAGSLLRSTLKTMKPSLSHLSHDETEAVNGLVALGEECDLFDVSMFVQKNWGSFRRAFIKLHPAHLLTVRNTRRALSEVGYKFPKRNLEEVSLQNSTAVQLFYSKVNDYVSNTCFSVEKELYPDKTFSVGFVRVSYQQRVASSLHSCRESLSRRLSKLLALRNELVAASKVSDSFLAKLGILPEMDDMANDDLLVNDMDMVDALKASEDKINMPALLNAANLECTNIQPLLNELDELLAEQGDMKIQKSIEIASYHLAQGDRVLLFSRYTDTVDALVSEFVACGLANECAYGIYVGQKSVIVRNGVETKCDKTQIKRELQAGSLKVMICSDAASEGLNLQAARVLINVDVPWTPARLEQRIGRIARLGQEASEVDVYNVWYPDSIEARMYHRIQKRLEESNIAIGEFPEVVADGIRNLVLQDKEQEDDSAHQLQEIRNMTQTKALNELWSYHDPLSTTSRIVRDKLIDVCKQTYAYEQIDGDGLLYRFELNNGREIVLSPLEGTDDSISMTSDPWSETDFELTDFGYVEDAMGNPSAFVRKGDSSSWLDHEAVVDLISGVPVTLAATNGRNPKLLPNPADLNLGYSVDSGCMPAPRFWPPLCKDER